MGLFDKVLGKKEEGPLTLNPREAFAAVAVAAVAADGVIEQSELQRLVGDLAEKKMFRNSNDLGNTLNKVASLIQKRGAGPVVKAAGKALSGELKPTAFAMATDLLLADGEVDQEERKFLEDFQKTLGIDDATAMKIVEVMAIKNRG